MSIKKLNIGIIGFGRIGQLHAQNIRRSIPEISISAVSDPFIEKSQAILENLEIPNSYLDYEELIAQKNIDAVLIASPHDTHTDIIKSACKANKHIFCEKPMSISSLDALSCKASLEHSGVKFQIGFNRRFDPTFSSMRKNIESGKIGDLRMVTILSADPAMPAKEYMKTSGHIGIFKDMSIHDFDMIRFLSGSEIEEVTATAAMLCSANKAGKAEFGNLDSAYTVIKLKSGALGMIQNCREAVFGYDQRAEVLGSLGMLSCENEYPSAVHIFRKEAHSREPVQYFFLERYAKAYVNELHAFAQALLQDTKPLLGFEDALAALLAAEAAERSLKERRPVKISEILPSS